MILLKKSIITEYPSYFVIPAKAGIQSFQVFKALQTGFPPSREWQTGSISTESVMLLVKWNLLSRLLSLEN